MSNTRANAAVPLEPSKHPNPAQAATNLDLHQSAVRSHRAFFAKAQHFNGGFPPWNRSQHISRRTAPGSRSAKIPFFGWGDALVRSIIPAEARVAFGRLRITFDDCFPTIREECP